MANWYVSPTGTDASGDGGTANPYRNIHKAIDAAGSGDTVWCYNGTYDGELTRDIGTRGITIRSVTGSYADVIVKPYTLGTAGGHAGWLTSTGGGLIVCNQATVILDDAHVTNWPSAPSTAAIAFCNSESTSPFFIGANSFFYHDGTGIATVVMHRNGTVLRTRSESALYKCTVRNFTNTWLSGQEGTITSRDCIFDDITTYVYNTDTGCKFSDNYNCFHNASVGKYAGTIGANSITADPLFTSATSPVIELASPCIDTGTTVAGYVESYGGSAPDMGCYEWSETAPQLLLYTGQYNNGTDTGTVNFSSRVLQIGDITESLMNGAESRGWVMQAAVTLDDSDQFWAGSFARGNHWLNGTFTLQQQFDGTWTPMLVGYVEPTDYTHDYGNREVSIQITSVLARVSYALVPYGVNERGTYDPYRPLARLMGTVSAVGTDGTVTLEPAEVQTGRIPHHSFIWQDVNGTVYPETGEQARLRGFVPENITSESGTVREMTFENGVPDWCTVGQVIYASEPWPTQQMLEIEVSRFYPNQKTYDLPHPLAALWYDACRQAGLTFEAASLAEFGTRLAYYQMACTAHVAAAAGYYAGYPWSNGTSPYYYGGEKWTDVLTDLFSSVGANWTVNGAGQVRAYLYQPGAQEPTGSLSFNSAYGDWTAALQEGASEVRVYSDYDPVEGYQGSYSLNTGASGPTVTINARWQRSTGGPLLASRLRFKLGSTGPAFGLVLDGTQWPNYQPGQTWTITDMPAELLPVTGSNLVIASKTYSYMNDTTTLDFITGAETTGIFRTGTIGTAPEPSTLDGTDILW